MIKKCLWMVGVVSVLGWDARGEETKFTSAPVVPSCSLTAPVTVTSGLFDHDPMNLQVDDRFAYFFTGSRSGRLSRVDKNGGSPILIGSFQQGGPPAYTLGGSQVFLMDWGAEGGNDFGPGSVLVRSQDLETTSYQIDPIPTRRETNTLIDAVADAAGNLYFAQANYCLVDMNCDGQVTYTLEWVPAGSRNASPIAQGPGYIQSLTLGGDNIFWVDDQGIWGARKTGGGGELLVPTTLPARDLQASQDAVFWATSDSNASGEGQTFRFDLATRTSAPILPYRLMGMRLDGGFLYGGIKSNTTGSRVNITRVKTNGHGQVFLAKGSFSSMSQIQVTTVAVDDKFVYFFDATGDALQKVCK